MQPLYYFNVKPQKSPDTVSEEGNEAEIRLPLRKLNGPKEASTPFFLGSPVNNQLSNHFVHSSSNSHENANNG